MPQSTADAIRATPRAVFDDGTVSRREVVGVPVVDPGSRSVPVRVALPRIKAGAPVPAATRFSARNGDTVDALMELTPGEVVGRNPANALRTLAAAWSAQGDRNG